MLNLEIHQLDVDSAFLYADLEEDLYMKPPPDHIKSKVRESGMRRRRYTVEPQ